jgi:hypothetical protein
MTYDVLLTACHTTEHTFVGDHAHAHAHGMSERLLDAIAVSSGQL